MNEKYFKHYDFFNMKSNDGLVIISNFKTYQQTTEYTCGPMCLKMVLEHYGYSYQEQYLEEICKSKPYTGTSLSNLENAVSIINKEIKCLKTISTLNGKSIKDYIEFRKLILENLKNNIPVIVENVDYGGHYKVIIGYDQVNENSSEDILIFADPYDNNDGKIDGYNYFPAERFFYMWFDEHCLPKNERQKAYLIIEKIQK